MKKIFESDIFDRSDWCYVMLGNHKDENLEYNKSCTGHEYKNLDSFFTHNLNKSLYDFFNGKMLQYREQENIKVLVSFNKIGWEVIKNGIYFDYEFSDKNNICLKTDQYGVYYQCIDKIHHILTTEDIFYKIEIWE